MLKISVESKCLQSIIHHMSIYGFFPTMLEMSFLDYELIKDRSNAQELSI